MYGAVITQPGMINTLLQNLDDVIYVFQIHLGWSAGLTNKQMTLVHRRNRIYNVSNLVLHSVNEVRKPSASSQAYFHRVLYIYA